MITIKESYEKTTQDMNSIGLPDRVVRKVTTYSLLGVPLLRTKRFFRIDY